LPDAEGLPSAAHSPPTSAKRGALNDGWHPWFGRQWILDRPHDVCYPQSTGGQRSRQQDRLELRSSTLRTGSSIVLRGQRHVYREVELGSRHVEADAFRSRGAPYAPPVQRRDGTQPATGSSPCGRERRILATKLEAGGLDGGRVYWD
jgi:hypothetical protein